MESVLKTIIIIELMFTIMKLFVAEQKQHNFWDSPLLIKQIPHPTVKVGKFELS